MNGIFHRHLLYIPLLLLLFAFSSSSLYERLISAYNEGNFEEALSYAEAINDSLKPSAEFLPLLASLYEKNGRYEEAGKFFKKAYKKKVENSDIFYSGFLRRQGRFEEAEKIIAKSLRSLKDTASVYFNELGLIYYQRAISGEARYFRDAFKWFARSANVDSVVRVKGNFAPKVIARFSPPSEAGKYYVSLCLTMVAGEPILVEKLSPFFILGDNSKLLLKPFEVESFVELFGSAYIQPGCTLCTADSAISLDLDIDASFDSTRFPSSLAIFSFRLFFLTRSLERDSFDYIAPGPLSQRRIDSLIANAVRRAIPGRAEENIYRFGKAFGEGVDYSEASGIIPDWETYIKLWAELEETTGCENRLALLDSLLVVYPDHSSLRELMAATLIVCGQLEHAHALLESLVTAGKASKWVYYNLGLVAFLKENKLEALEQFKKAYGKDDNFAQAYLARGIILEDEGRFEEALWHYRKYLTLTSKRRIEVKEWITAIEAQLKERSGNK